MDLFSSLRLAFAAEGGATGDLPADAAPADEREPPPADLRCVNEDCDLFHLRLEPDEVTPTPGAQPDRCASCGGPLKPFSG